MLGLTLKRLRRNVHMQSLLSHVSKCHSAEILRHYWWRSNGVGSSGPRYFSRVYPRYEEPLIILLHRKYFVFSVIKFIIFKILLSVCPCGSTRLFLSQPCCVVTPHTRRSFSIDCLVQNISVTN